MRPHLSIGILAVLAASANAAHATTSPATPAPATTIAAATAPEKLTIERIYSSPALDGSLPTSIQFSKDGKKLSFLKPKLENFEVLDLWEFDFATNQPRLLVDSKSLDFGSLSEEEKARRERMRISSQGIVEYIWSNDSARIAFPAGGDLYLYESGQKLKRLTQNPTAAEIDIKFSPKNRFVSFIRDQNLHILDLSTTKETPVTTTGKDTLSYGVAEFIAQEEMERFSGYWWSDDESMLAFTEVDESPVKEVDRYEINDASVVSRKQRYPETGSANAKVRLGVIKVDDLQKGKTTPTWIPLGNDSDIYLARVDWTPNGKLVTQVQSRDQKTLTVSLYDPQTQKTKTLLTEKDRRWVELSNDLRWLKNNQWIWSSEKSGYRHLYLHAADGKLIRPLTQGNWPVDELAGVDEKGGWVYFTSGMNNPLERHLYRASLDRTGEPQRITRNEGFDTIVMDKGAQKFILTTSTHNQPSSISVYESNGKRLGAIEENKIDSKHPLAPYKDALVNGEFGSFKNPNGDLLYFQIHKPKNFDPKKKYPLIVMGYGGPTSQVVKNAWDGRNGFFKQVLVDRGYVVASFDNRGTPRRSADFARAHHHAFGVIEVEDQTAGAKHLIKQGWVDPQRVGFFGWSYGGYLSILLAEKSGDVFHANAAGAPVTDFSLYDTHYTERYLGKPQDEKKVYEKANALNFAKDLNARLLILHGMADDNVLFTNSTMLFKKLQESGKLYESVTYPGSKHGIYGRQNRIHVYSTILDFFDRHIGPRGPEGPAGARSAP